MKFADPIRYRRKIAHKKTLLRGQKRYRHLLLFVVGINTAFRISDLRKLQVNHFIENDGIIRKRFWIKEEKRGKRQEITINFSIQEALRENIDTFSHIVGAPEKSLFFKPRTGNSIKRAQTWNSSQRSVKMLSQRKLWNT